MHCTVPVWQQTSSQAFPWASSSRQIVKLCSLWLNWDLSVRPSVHNSTIWFAEDSHVHAWFKSMPTPNTQHIAILSGSLYQWCRLLLPSSKSNTRFILLFSFLFIHGMQLNVSILFENTFFRAVHLAFYTDIDILYIY